VCFDFFYKFFWHIFHSKKSRDVYDKKCLKFFMWSTRYSCPILMKLEFSGQFFEKHSSITFRENPSGGSRGVPCGQTDGKKEGRTDMTKLIVAFRNVANAPKNGSLCVVMQWTNVVCLVRALPLQGMILLSQSSYSRLRPPACNLHRAATLVNCVCSIKSTHELGCQPFHLDCLWSEASAVVSMR